MLPWSHSRILLNWGTSGWRQLSHCRFWFRRQPWISSEAAWRDPFFSDHFRLNLQLLPGQRNWTKIIDVFFHQLQNLTSIAQDCPNDTEGEISTHYPGESLPKKGPRWRVVGFAHCCSALYVSWQVWCVLLWESCNPPCWADSSFRLVVIPKAQATNLPDVNETLCINNGLEMGGGWWRFVGTEVGNWDEVAGSMVFLRLNH